MLVVLALAVGVIAPTQPAAAAAVDRTVFMHHAVSGATVFITECTVTNVWVHAGITQRGALVRYTRLIVDNCTGEESAVIGRARPRVFRFSEERLAARLVATIPVKDVTTGEPAGQVTVDNTWSGVTAANSEYAGWSRETVRSPGGVEISVRPRGRAALAEVTGAPQLDNATIGRRHSLTIAVCAQKS